MEISGEARTVSWKKTFYPRVSAKRARQSERIKMRTEGSRVGQWRVAPRTSIPRELARVLSGRRIAGTRVELSTFLAARAIYAPEECEENRRELIEELL